MDTLFAYSRNKKSSPGNARVFNWDLAATLIRESALAILDGGVALDVVPKEVLK